MGTLKQIYDGWKSYIVPDPETLEIAKARAKICSGCDKVEHGVFEIFLPDFELKEIKGLKCGICNCPLSTATRSKDYHCPLGLW